MPAKPEALALAKAKKALRKFTGDLATPILVPSPEVEWGPLSPESLKHEIAAKRLAKLRPLFSHYRIRPEDKDRCRKLAGCLAKDFVPGMITVEQRSSPYRFKRPHRDKRWDVNRLLDLAKDVQAREGKILARIYDLVNTEKWGAYKGREASLEARYYEGAKIFRAANRNAPIGLWDPSKS
jgi:hypothetical protein